MTPAETPGIRWDPRKGRTNLRKHGVSFIEAATVFTDYLLLTKIDPDHSIHENRFMSLGLSSLNKLILVAHTDDGDEIRIISARLPTRNERHAYDET